MTTAETVRQEFFNALCDFLSVRSPSFELRCRMHTARLDAKMRLTEADFDATVLAAKRSSSRSQHPLNPITSNRLSAAMPF
jgi:hypothetical protein